MGVSVSSSSPRLLKIEYLFGLFWALGVFPFETLGPFGPIAWALALWGPSSLGPALLSFGVLPIQIAYSGS